MLIIDLHIVKEFPKLLGIFNDYNRISLGLPYVFITDNIYENNDKDLFDLLFESAKHSYIIFLDNKGLEKVEPYFRKMELNITNTNLLKLKFGLFQRLKHPDSKVLVYLTQINTEVTEFCKKYNIKVVNRNDIQDLTSKLYVLKLDTDRDFESKLYKYVYFNKYPFLILLLKLMVILVFMLLFNNGRITFYGDNIFQKILIQIAMVLIGIIAYIFREKMKAIYGFFEILIGLKMVNIALYNTGLNYVNYSSDFKSTILFLGGFYVIVRGIDNIMKGSKNIRMVKYIVNIFGIGK